jgi:hypothetical protein
MAFSIKDNFKDIAWGQTILLHLMRSVCAAVVWTIVAFACGAKAEAFQILIMVPAGYLLGVPIIFGMLKIVAGIFSIVGLGEFANLGYGLFSLIGALGIMVGDPLLFALNKIKPGLLPVEKFGFLNFCMILFVMKHGA